MSGLQKNVIKELFFGYITVSLLWRHQWYMYTELICSLNIEPLFVRCHPLNTFFKSRTSISTQHNVKKPIHINYVPQNKRGIDLYTEIHLWGSPKLPLTKRLFHEILERVVLCSNNDHHFYCTIKNNCQLNEKWLIPSYILLEMPISLCIYVWNIFDLNKNTLYNKSCFTRYSKWEILISLRFYMYIG